LVAALAARLLECRRRVTAAVGLLTIAALAAMVVLALSRPGDPTALILGRTLTLTALARGLLLLIYSLTGGLLALHWFRPVSRSFVAVALALLSPLAAALLIAPLGLGLALLAVALALAAVALYGGRYAAAGAAWRAFLLGVLGLLPLLWVAWAQAAGQTGAALPLVMALSTLLLLGGFPFHVGLRSVARWSPPGALALALGPAQIVVVALLFGLLDLTPVARAAAEFQAALRGSALLAALLAAFLMQRERTWRGVLSGALLLDAGGLTLAALAPGAAGLAVALAALTGRTLSLLLIALSLSWPAGGERRADGLRRALLLYGALSLLGLPLTPGFAGRWAQVSLLGAAWPWAAVLLLAALGAAGWGVWRVWRREQEAPTTFEVKPAPGAATGGQHLSHSDEAILVGTLASRPVERGEWVAALILLSISALLGLFPGLLTALAARLAG
jgi:hypothetical protein